jgi:hypothetical protein
VRHEQAQISPASHNTKPRPRITASCVAVAAIFDMCGYLLSVAVAMCGVWLSVACGLRLVAASGLNVGHGKPGAHRPPVVSII